MSVAPKDPNNLSPLHKPPELNGLGSYPIWRISHRALDRRLRYRPTSATHGVIEPAYRMALREYEAALESTREGWKRVLG